MTDTAVTAPTATLKMTTLDAGDVAAEATFWAGLLGWKVAHQQEEYAMLTGPSGAPALGIGLVADHQPPTWPDEGGRKQFHLDLACDDIPATEDHALGLGATLANPQPGETWRVLISPAGHPFCLTNAANW
ncbi:VOC family protein [Micromonospora sp. WMMD714]|uniref:VOC family protein n=1 Tax=Micromonospora sp. WMMD714 TaxID=3016097 RepID=UPI00249B7A33|nr:VOC family protein [Micromonospora sp. WMMD714]WFE62907.1 VOC family protein [Micromonospora sp. WMMD714]